MREKSYVRMIMAIKHIAEAVEMFSQNRRMNYDFQRSV